MDFAKKPRTCASLFFLRADTKRRSTCRGLNTFHGVGSGQAILEMNNRKTVLSLSFVTPANLWIWVNRGWNSREFQSSSNPRVAGHGNFWWLVRNLQCQHSCSTELSICTQYVSNFLSMLVTIRSPDGREEQKVCTHLGLNVAPSGGECSPSSLAALRA